MILGKVLFFVKISFTFESSKGDGKGQGNIYKNLKIA